MVEPLQPADFSPRARQGSLPAYLAAAAITVVAVLSPYFLPRLVPAVTPVYRTLASALLVAYGIPIVGFLLLVGTRPISRYFREPRRAVVEGLRWYGLIFLLTFLVLLVLVAVLTALYPDTPKVLMKPNPAVEQARSNPWFWVGFAFVIGLAEETIFRGWVFGYWLSRGVGSWVVPGVLTSLLFAALHLYYGITYGVASAVAFVQLFMLGFAFSGAVRYGRGAIFMVALLHGAYDSAGFLRIISQTAGLIFEYSVVLGGAIVGAVQFFSSRSKVPTPITPWADPSWRPGLVGAGPNPALDFSVTRDAPAPSVPPGFPRSPPPPPPLPPAAGPGGP